MVMVKFLSRLWMEGRGVVGVRLGGDLKALRWWFDLEIEMEVEFRLCLTFVGGVVYFTRARLRQ